MTTLPPSPPAEPVPSVADRLACAGLLLTPVLTALAVLAGALLYGLVAYFTESVYFYLTVICGVMVGAALAYGFPRQNWLAIGLVLLIPAVVLALLSIALGELLFYTLAVARESGTSLTAAAGDVLLSAVEILTDSEVYLPYGLSALGAVGGVFGVLRRK